MQKNKQPNQKVGKRLKQTFLQRHTDANKHMKRCLTSLIITEMPKNYNEESSHTNQNGNYQKNYKEYMLK